MPATGAAPLPRVDVLTALPELGPDDVFAVPVGSGAALPPWLAGAVPVLTDAEFLAGALADTGNTGRPGTVTNVPIAGRRPRSVVAVGVGEPTLPGLRPSVATAVGRAQTVAELRAPRLVLTFDSPTTPAGAVDMRA